ncbi:MAG: serine/threonine-protein kinase, partial [Planctomycetota bacterium]
MEHGRILDLFARALDLPETERERFLDEQHIEDGAARAELSSLLSLASPARSFLEDPVFRISPQESAARVRCLNATDSDRHSRALPLRVDDTRARDVVRAEESIDGLRIVSKLGSGGMGVVYLAEQSAPIRRRVALKLMRLGVEDDESRLRFRLECQALALMDHPSIARVHDAGTTADGRPYLTMEYVPGTAIDRYCDERRLSIAARLRLFLQVCEGVQHAHHVGIVHRDLKPSNILVRDDHGAPSPKIIDFGVAKATVQGLTEQSLHTSPGSSIGTPDYMSPEQATSAGRDVDSRTDVYALGVVLYQLLVGRLPHEFHARPRSTWGAIERALADEEPPLPSRALASLGERANEVASRRSTALGALRRAVSGDLGFVVAKAIEKERARRYSTVSELAAELRRYLGNEPVLASPPSSVYRARKFVRRNKHWVALFAVLVLGLAGTVRMTFVVAAARDRADESLAVAREQAAYTLPLSDAARLADLRAQLGVLWPPRAERVPALDECLVVAGDLVSRRAQHALLLERVSGTADAPRGARVFPWMSARERESYARMVGELVRGLDELVDPRTPIGGITEIERRRDFARDLERDSLLEAAALWREAIESIADAQECPRYGGLALAPQLGLIPIGRDEQSGLWEFAHL